MQKPNIILILADDLGYGDVSHFNENSGFVTENLDKLCEEGMSFTDCHASFSVCTPSRYSILTGRYNWRSPLKKGVMGGYDAPLLEENRKTIASMLKENDYKTAAVGKWHLGMEFQQADSKNFGTTVDFAKPIINGPINHGFDYYFGITASLDMPPYVYIENDHFLAQDLKMTENKGFQTMWRNGPTAANFDHSKVLENLTDKVIEKITEYSTSDNPFFIYFPMTAPHTPILPSEEFLGKSGTNIYGDFVMMLDAMVGKIMATIKDKDIEDNTIIMFASDNGCSDRANYEELEKYGHNPSYIFKGKKFDIYEGGHRIPFIMKWPKVIDRNVESKQLVSLVDIYATLAEIIGYRASEAEAEDSFSLLSMMGGNSEQKVRESLVHQSHDGSLSIRKGNYKLEMCPGSGSGFESDEQLPSYTNSYQLYDLSNDIGETKNIYGDHQELCESLKEDLTKIVRAGRSNAGLPQHNEGEEVWKAVSWLKK